MTGAMRRFAVHWQMDIALIQSSKHAILFSVCLLYGIPDGPRLRPRLNKSLVLKDVAQKRIHTSHFLR
jgi:hypothetical protein